MDHHRLPANTCVVPHATARRRRRAGDRRLHPGPVATDHLSAACAPQWHLSHIVGPSRHHWQRHDATARSALGHRTTRRNDTDLRRWDMASHSQRWLDLHAALATTRYPRDSAISASAQISYEQIHCTMSRIGVPGSRPQGRPPRHFRRLANHPHESSTTKAVGPQDLPDSSARSSRCSRDPGGRPRWPSGASGRGPQPASSRRSASAGRVITSPQFVLSRGRASPRRPATRTGRRERQTSSCAGRAT